MSVTQSTTAMHTGISYASSFLGDFQVNDLKCLCFKTSSRRNLLYENELDLHENKPAGGTHFRMNDFALKLILMQRKGQLSEDFLRTLK